MPAVKLKENEPFDIALRRFKRACTKHHKIVIHLGPKARFAKSLELAKLHLEGY